jgi:hypothetical protein
MLQRSSYCEPSNLRSTSTSQIFFLMKDNIYSSWKSTVKGRIKEIFADDATSVLSFQHYMHVMPSLPVINACYKPSLVTITMQHKVYKEYHSVCPLVGLGTLPTPTLPASVPLPAEPGGGGHTRVRGWGSPNSDDWRKSLALCLLCAMQGSYTY